MYLLELESLSKRLTITNDGIMWKKWDSLIPLLGCGMA